MLTLRIRGKESKVMTEFIYSNETRLWKFKPQSLRLQKETPGCSYPEVTKGRVGERKGELEREIQNLNYFFQCYKTL